MVDWIRIKGARQNNLKNIDVAIPKQRLVVITGPSGAGKSSLAFDTLYAEGHRRYMEALSPSARQLIGQLDKPDLDALEGLSPAIAVEQRAGSPNPRSTVGTSSDIYDYLRLLYARVGQPYCYQCGAPIAAHTVQQIVDAALARADQPRLLVCAPVQWSPELDFAALLEGFRREGFVRVRVDGAVYLLEEAPPPPAAAGVGLELVVDRLALAGVDKQRLTEAVELAFGYGEGLVTLVFLAAGGEEAVTYSRTPRCTTCGISYPAPHPNLFSFNSPNGACLDCHGLGTQLSVSRELVVPDPRKTLAEGAIAPWEKKTSLAFHQTIEQVAEHYGFSIFTPFQKLDAAHQDVLLYGSGTRELEFTYEGEETSYRYSRPFEGVIDNLERRFRETESAAVREEIRRYMEARVCPVCEGQRLRRESRHYRLGDRTIAQVTALPLPAAREWVRALQLRPMEQAIAGQLVRELERRLGFLIDVGLDYLSLERPMDTLSTGESQRIRLATQIGSALSGVIYVLDEPTVGLHQRDTERLLATLDGLRDAGNTVVVVEHDRDTMLAADWLIEIGPQAGEAGGHLVAAGTLDELCANPASITGPYLTGARAIPVPAKRRRVTWQKLELSGASANNLRDVRLTVPLGLLVCVTGPSGSGKSTLILDTLYPAVLAALRGESLRGLPLKGMKGIEYLDRVVHVDQSAIGKSSRSNPGTYLGVFEQVREQFAAVPEARARGYAARRFSFNVEGGRCEACQGEGVKRIEMHFLPDVFVRCDVCDGARYNRETLEIRYRGKTIADILNLTLSELEQFFRAIPAIRNRLAPMLDIGLGYLRLGQPANTLSGGEAQRLKIARELGRKDSGRTLYLLDEPTTGLHFEDIERLLAVLQQLVRAGNSVVVIEHNLELIKCADHVIDLGPEGGDRGGEIVAEGTPEALLEAQEQSHTARYLAPYLTGSGASGKRKADREGKVLAWTGDNP
ncbi:MAG TPA: excinuclease ABC subunit UvrA [bacterium]|nr:excinuclease ABC subunit UvrA [bacterium]